MRSNVAGFAALILLVIVVVVGLSSIFTVQQTELALVLRFGEPVSRREVIEPGLHFKLPFVDTVVLLDKRILDLETPSQEVLLSDTQRVEVDAFARYRIVNPLLFYQTVNSITRANNQLASVLNSAVRNILGDATLPQIVHEEREALMARIREQVNSQGETLGVNVVDVRIRHSDLPREISEKVYDRMRSEWQRDAAKTRGQGNEQSLTIKANADRQVTILKANAQQQADCLRGEGDALRNKIFADAYGKDPDFFAFYRSMQAYEGSLKSASTGEAGAKSTQTTLVLSPTSDFFRYFNSVTASMPAAPPNLPAPAGQPNEPAIPAPTPVPDVAHLPASPCQAAAFLPAQPTAP